MLCAFGIMLIQCLRWLQDGYWIRLQFRLAWKLLGQIEEPLTSHGVENLRTWILDLPLSLGIWFGPFLSDRAEHEERHLKRAEDEKRCKAP
jgi:hypothetical protein